MSTKDRPTVTKCARTSDDLQKAPQRLGISMKTCIAIATADHETSFNLGFCGLKFNDEFIKNLFDVVDKNPKSTRGTFRG